MDYTEYKYLWPPRPETKAIPSALRFLHDQGYVAQVKKNGTCTVIFAKGNTVIFKTRHRDDNDGNHKAWTPLKEHVDMFKSKSKKWNVYVAELLHSKTPHIKNHLYLFDKIVHDGVQLVGKTFLDRQEILHGDFSGKDVGDRIEINQYMSIAKTFADNFDVLWQNLKSEDEGLVLKRANAELERCIRQSSNAAWQVKVRKPSSNYSF